MKSKSNYKYGNRDFADRIADYFTDYDISIVASTEDLVLIIKNPNIDSRDIKVCFTKREIFAYFSFYHNHFEYEYFEQERCEYIIDFINDIISNTMAVLVVCKNCKKCVISLIKNYSSYDFTSVDKIVENIEHFSMNKNYWLEMFKSNGYMFYIKSWNSGYDKSFEIKWDGTDYLLFNIPDTTSPIKHKEQ